MAHVELDNGGTIAVLVLGILYILFQATVASLIIYNKVRRRRRQKHALATGYKPIGSDVELGRVVSQEEEGNSIPQLPTNADGGEDLEGKPKLEVQGEPVYQLDGCERPRPPYELQGFGVRVEREDGPDHRTNASVETQHLHAAGNNSGSTGQA
ncbi:hypothetical protein K469DRAFT_744850 [Zopfia rhizophila CBS 207.26]|uniref:Uncharacterized protein n=1 Tax=Zopfia rhizophila CBS 207.26 TaxID=1314779 RepID=A0A6A6ETT8_9PEZI|nr:hypothetical protein K469DRAFT_744850 [Zopfia rhizophila CBS 207.26]